MANEWDESESDGSDSTAHRFKIAISKDRMQVNLYPLIGVTDGGLTTIAEVLDACARENIKL